jgi:hypothetical protein
MRAVNQADPEKYARLKKSVSLSMHLLGKLTKENDVSIDRYDGLFLKNEEDEPYRPTLIDSAFERNVFGIGSVRIEKRDISELEAIAVRATIYRRQDTYLRYDDKFVFVQGSPKTTIESMFCELRSDKLQEHAKLEKLAALALKQELVLKKLEEDSTLTDLFIVDDRYCKMILQNGRYMPVLFTCEIIDGNSIPYMVQQRQRFKETLRERRLHLVNLSESEVSVEIISKDSEEMFKQPRNYEITQRDRQAL